MAEVVSFILYLVIMIGIYGILSLSLNFQYGISGLANFGQVAFLAIGAYASVIALKVVGAPFIVGVLAAMLAAGLFGYILTFPVADLEEDALAIVTLAAAEIVRLFFLNEGWVTGGGPYTGGALGVGNIPQPARGYFSNFTYQIFYAGLVVSFLIAVYWFFKRVTNSPFGRTLKMIREDEQLPKAMGKNVGIYRMKALAIGAAIAGISGSLLASYLTFISPSNFKALITFLVWAMVVVGGRGNYLGVIVGTAFVQLLFMGSRFFKDYIPMGGEQLASLRMVFIGLLIVLVMMFARRGIWPERKVTYDLEKGERASKG